MSPIFVFLLVSVQICLIQNAYSQCLGSSLGFGCGAFAGPTITGWGGAGNAGFAGCAGATYGGAGVGNVAIEGALPVSGTTVLSGLVPIIGAVSFGGPVPAVGSVTITGSCACGCGPSSPYGIY